jgi:allantoinase
VGHGHTNSERQGELSEADEKTLLRSCKQIIREKSGQDPAGWLSPWISESLLTPDLLAEAGYRYTLNWCHDDQPTKFATRSGKTLWSIPYPQELNDIPMIVARQMDARAFADMIVDNFDEMLRQSEDQPLVMGLALHPYLVGQPYRLRHLRRALKHVRAKGRKVWFTTPGAICAFMER